MRRDRGLGERNPRCARCGDAGRCNPEPPLPASEEALALADVVFGSIAELTVGVV